MRKLYMGSCTSQVRLDESLRDGTHDQKEGPVKAWSVAVAHRDAEQIRTPSGTRVWSA